jgi:hypothetical protein
MVSADCGAAAGAVHGPVIYKDNDDPSSEA